MIGFSRGQNDTLKYGDNGNFQHIKIPGVILFYFRIAHIWGITNLWMFTPKIRMCKYWSCDILWFDPCSCVCWSITLEYIFSRFVYLNFKTCQLEFRCVSGYCSPIIYGWLWIHGSLIIVFCCQLVYL